jgi:t-SNARE complex subunit (syntaxin)
LLSKLLVTLDELRQSNQQLQSLLRNSESPKPPSNIEVVLADLDQVVRRIDMLIKHQYPNIDLAIRNITDGSASLKEGLKDVKKQPSKLLFSNPPAKSETVE